MRALRALLVLLACGDADFEVEAADYGPPPAPRDVTPRDAAEPSWPRALARLAVLPVPAEGPGRRWRVLVDAGHGAKGNDGNTGLYCQRERDVTLSVAEGLATRLALMGPFEVRLARAGGSEPGYGARKALAEAWPADAVVSLHTDVRGQAAPFITPGCASFRNDAEPGFAVLWSAEGAEALAARQRALSWALTGALSRAGFLPYSGVSYAGLYDAEPEHPGSFSNRERHARRIWFLRSLWVPAVIVELHHALDADEVARWAEPRTRHAFAYAVAAALLDFFGEARAAAP